MSSKERRRLELLARVRDRILNLVKAAELMQVSYRQAKRLWRRFRQHGDVGLVHRLRGRPSLHAKPATTRQSVLRRYRERYPDFGPTLAAEQLAKDGYALDHETLRRWLIQEGLWQRQRRGRQHRHWRERKAHPGELVQMDGSHHDWFEGRRAPAVLMVMIDDATNRTYARFFEGETTWAAMETFARYSRRHGLPQALYVDLDSIYRTDREPTVAEQLRGEVPRTQFGRAMERLGVRLVLAYSPQAKGRVERRNGLLQDRLVKALRLARSRDLETANALLETEFLAELNERFCVAAAAPGDLHRALPPGVKLAEVLSLEETRVVAADWTLSWQGRYLQLRRQDRALGLVGKPITVRQLRDGGLQLLHQGQPLAWHALPDRPKPRPWPPPQGGQPRRTRVPFGDHPWRRFGIARGANLCRELATGQRRLPPRPRRPFAPATDRVSLKEGSPQNARGPW